MRRPLPLVLALFAALPVVAAQESTTAPAAPAVSVVHCGHLFDSESGRMLGETSITVVGDRIQSVHAGAPQSGMQVIELGNATCLPGLIDSHVHLTDQTSPSKYSDQFRWNAADYAIRSTVYAQRTLMAGFTTVRNVADNDYDSVSLRNAVNAGIVPGPRIFTAGTAIGSTGGHADPTDGYRRDLAGDPATFHQAILIQTMFTAKQAMIDVNGEYTLSGMVRAGIVNGKPGGTSNVSITVNQSLGNSLNGVSVGINGLVLGYSAKIIAGIGAYSFVVGPYASLSTTVGATRGSDAQTAMVGYTCRSAEFHMWMDYGVGVAVPNFVVKVLNGILSVFSSKAAISSSYSTKLGTVVIKDIMEYIPEGCAPKA